MKGLNKNKILSIIIAVVIFLLGGRGGFILSRLTLSSELKSLDFIIKAYKQYYYEESDDIIGDMASGLLDKFSEYYSKEEYEEVEKASKGERAGIGLAFYTGTNYIYKVTGNSPCYKVGVEAGGYVIKTIYNGETTSIGNFSEFSSSLKNIPTYTDFQIVVKYGDEEKTYTIQKKEYSESYVFYYDESGSYAYLDDSGTMSLIRVGDNTKYPMQSSDNAGVIEYTGFSSLSSGLYGSAGQFEGALNKFKQNNKTHLILDLRNNGGGYVSIMANISSHLIACEDNKTYPVMLERYKNNVEKIVYSNSVDYHTYNFSKITVLANQNSASASECLMGAMLDYNKDKISIILEGYKQSGGTIYKTYGKGIMQTTYESITGEAIKLTTAKIYWPVTNTTIHEVGITPQTDSRVKGESGENMAYYDAIS